jgi:Caspase domain/Domain of unknown function (DUF4384)
MRLDRRTFLQRAGLGLLTLGIGSSQSGWWQNRLASYHQALAATTPRKLALLIGINDYTDDANLKGCLSDVELQKELLVYRFGFKQQDILTLTGDRATREAIETAFVEHLIKQAAPGDVVVFHFSGYGRKVYLPQPEESLVSGEPERSLNSLMPSDAILATKNAPVTNDLLEETLLLLGRSLKTERVTFILDTSFHSTGQLLQGNLHGRSFPNPAEKSGPEELAFQKQLQQQLPSSKPFSGTILAAAQPKQVATEIAIDGFSAGLFTYTLTQYLWEVTPTNKIYSVMKRTAEQMAATIGTKQEPQFSGDKQLLTYYSLPNNLIKAQGIITRVDDDRSVKIALTGLPANVLEDYGLNSCWTVVGSPQSEVLQILSVKGIAAKAKLLNEPDPQAIPLQVGQLVRESIRMLPHNLSLTVALDRSLERIERVDATSAFSGITAVKAAIAVGEQVADCVLGKIPATDTEKLLASGQDTPGIAPLWKGYGLFTVGGEALPTVQGTVNEAVKSAIARLEPQFQKLLAAKLWRLTANEGSSGLEMSASLEVVGKTSRVLQERDTRPQAKPTMDSLARTALLPRVPIGTQIQYRIENFSDRPIYFLLLGMDSSSNAIALYTPQTIDESALKDKTSQLQQRCILPGDRLIVPSASDPLDSMVSAPSGLTEIQIIASFVPFTKTLEALSSIDYLKGDKEQILKLPNPLEVSLALLEDLHQASAVKSEILGALTDVYALDNRVWATLSFVYQVVSSS